MTEPVGADAPTLPVCATCGSADVRRDAWAVWSIDRQTWELGETFDAAVCCGRCDGETTLEMIPLEAYRRQRIRQLNDRLRRGEGRGLHDQVVTTAGIAALPAEDLQAVIKAVQTFDGFTGDNDPYGEHDFGSLEVAGEHVFFKIDYYDVELAMHSPDPTDPSVTARVLTTMLASEY